MLGMGKMVRILNSVFVALVIVPLAPVAADAGPEPNLMTLYKTPECGCCEGHAAYLRQNGFEVKIVDTDDLDLLKTQLGVPEELAGCHTILVDGYVVEGHVSANSIQRLLSERPPVTGIALPGMPMGSPGMPGEKEGPSTISTFGGQGEPQVYTSE
jgi:hypothetical protein